MFIFAASQQIQKNTKVRRYTFDRSTSTSPVYFFLDSTLKCEDNVKKIKKYKAAASDVLCSCQLAVPYALIYAAARSQSVIVHQVGCANWPHLPWLINQLCCSLFQYTFWEQQFLFSVFLSLLFFSGIHIYKNKLYYFCTKIFPEFNQKYVWIICCWPSVKKIA